MGATGMTGGVRPFVCVKIMVCTLGFQSVCEIADFRDVFKFYACILC